MGACYHYYYFFYRNTSNCDLVFIFSRFYKSQIGRTSSYVCLLRGHTHCRVGIPNNVIDVKMTIISFVFCALDLTRGRVIHVDSIDFYDPRKYNKNKNKSSIFQTVNNNERIYTDIAKTPTYKYG